MRKSFCSTLLPGVLSIAAAALLAGCSSSTPMITLGPGVPASVKPATGYSVFVFAGPSAAGKAKSPDSIILSGTNVFVGYGNGLNPDGTVPGTTSQGKSTIIQFDTSGNVIKTFSVTGHNDGLLAFDSATIWAMSNEDSNPILTVINLTGGFQTEYTPATPLLHGGGLDDMQKIGSTVYASASNPNLNPDGSVVPAPAVVAISLNAVGQTFNVKPILQNNATATNIVTGATVTLNLTDPDSEATDPNGNLVLDSQADSELVFVQNVGTGTQAAQVLPLTLGGTPTQVDDTRWVPKGLGPFMLFTDTSANTIYRVNGNAVFKAGDAYTASNGTINQILKLDPKTGDLTTIIDGLGSPHGMVFLLP